MSPTELRRLMHAELDGEASPAESRALHEQLAADAAARAEYDQLQALFQQLGALPQPHPPEGLVASVTAALQARQHASADQDQLFGSSRVLASNNPRSLTMSQSASLFTNRKTWIGAGIAALALVVVFNLNGPVKKEDTAGTIVPAERYRATQATQDMQLGDQSVAKLMQNDAFLRLVKDPAVRTMLSDPGFQAAAKALAANPEAAKVVLANAELAKALASNSEAARAVLADAEVARANLANAELARGVLANADLARSLAQFPDLAKVVSNSAEAARSLANNADAAKATLQNAELAKTALQNAELAKVVAGNADLARLLAGNAEAARLALVQTEAARVLANNAEAARVLANNAEAARVLMGNPEAARLLANNAEAARLLLNNAEAAKSVLANAEAARALAQSPDASIRAMYQSIDAARVSK